MIKAILIRIIYFYLGGLVAVYPFVRVSLQQGSSASQIIKDWLLWPGLYF